MRRSSRRAERAQAPSARRTARGSFGLSSAGTKASPRGYLAGTPFPSFLVPGLVLAVVVGGAHLAALVRSAWAPLTAAVAGFGLLVWIFVQMVVILYSPLQAVYEGAAVVELALLLVELGVLDVLRPRGARTRAAHGRAA